MNHYTLGQISKAAAALSKGWAGLPDRIQEAWSHLSHLSGADLSGFEKEFEIIRECRASVQNGDWSRVTGEQCDTIAAIIREMDLRSARFITIKEDVRVLASSGSGIGAQGFCENN